MENTSGDAESSAVRAIAADSESDKERARIAAQRAVRTGAVGPGAGKMKRDSSSHSNGHAKGDASNGATVEPVEISLRSLLEAGVHFGHQTSRWSPSMSPYIYGSRNGIHIINLPRTVQCWQRARQSIVDVVALGGSVLFVGTKKQAQDGIAEAATRCGSYYVSQRWLGGMLTNFSTIRKSVDRMRKLEETLAEEEEALKNGTGSKFTKKERLMISRELEKLNFSLGGIREMSSLPSLLFVIDVKREEIAVKEARRLDIPVVALVDTNCDPSSVNYPIPSNDDGTRAIRLFAQAVADAILEGKKAQTPKASDQRAAATPEAPKPVVTEAAPAAVGAE